MGSVARTHARTLRARQSNLRLPVSHMAPRVCTHRGARDGRETEAGFIGGRFSLSFLWKVGLAPSVSVTAADERPVC